MTTFEIGTVKTDKYANEIYPLTKEEYEGLKQDIAEHGLYEPITINEHGDVLDGHHRLRACQELGITPEFKVKESKSELEERLFVIDINFVRRQLNDYQRGKLALKKKPILELLAKQNMSKAGKGVEVQTPLGRVDEILAKQARMGKDTLRKIEQIEKEAAKNPDRRLGSDYDNRFRGRSGPTYSDVRRDAEAGKITPSKAHSLINRQNKIIKKWAEVETSAKSLSLPDKVTLLNKDSRKIKELDEEIADNSVDLIITDPPYLSGSLPLFQGLARLASTKLKEGGSVVFFYGPHLEPKIHKIFAKYGKNLTWWWRFCVKHEGHSSRFHARGVWVESKPMMWFVKGKNKLTINDIPDFIQSGKPDKTKHPWAQCSVEAEYIIKNLTVSEHSLVVDPFLGSGAFAIPAIKLGRYFVGIEIDKQVFENARTNILTVAVTSAAPAQEEVQKNSK